MNYLFINRALLLLLLSCVSGPAQSSLPSLRMTASNGVSTVFWPLTAYSDILQTATTLSPTTYWTNLATGDLVVAINTYNFFGGTVLSTTSIVGNEIALALPATNRQQFFRLSSPRALVPCSFAIFYNGLLEFSQTATMVINGRVHANGPIYVGTTASLTFNAPVTTTADLSAPLVDGIPSGWTPGNPSTWNVDFYGTPGYITNTTGLGISSLNQTNYHLLIDMPPAGEDPVSGPLRLYYEAYLVLFVTNDISGSGNPTVQFIIQNSVNGQWPGADPSKVIFIYTNAYAALLKTNLPFLSLTNLFYDQRERKTNLITQIDVGYLAAWLSTNATVQAKLPSSSSLYPTILYVADRRKVSPTQLAVVRLQNAAQLPANNNMGFTVATMNPLYVQGNYNVQISGSSANASAGTSNTTNTVPAALLSDSLTVLSAHWTDASSYTTYFQQSAFNAVDDTINAVIMTGTVASTGTGSTNFSGGLHNLPRLLENWSSANLWLNTSIIRLWDSQWATNQFRNPLGFSPPPVNPYYNPPTRHFSFDPNLLNNAKIPPGIPLFD